MLRSAAPSSIKKADSRRDDRRPAGCQTRRQQRTRMCAWTDLLVSSASFSLLFCLRSPFAFGTIERARWPHYSHALHRHQKSCRQQPQTKPGLPNFLILRLSSLGCGSDLFKHTFGEALHFPRKKSLEGKFISLPFGRNVYSDSTHIKVS